MRYGWKCGKSKKLFEHVAVWEGAKLSVIWPKMRWTEKKKKKKARGNMSCKTVCEHQLTTIKHSILFVLFATKNDYLWLHPSWCCLPQSFSCCRLLIVFLAQRRGRWWPIRADSTVRVLLGCQREPPACGDQRRWADRCVSHPIGIPENSFQPESMVSCCGRFWSLCRWLIFWYCWCFDLLRFRFCCVSFRSQLLINPFLYVWHLISVFSLCFDDGKNNTRIRKI